MKYFGVAHHITTNPELVALYRHGKSFRFLPKEHADKVMDKIGDIGSSNIPRDTPEEALNDAIALCKTQGIELGYAMIKREDGHYFTDVKNAKDAEKGV